MHYTRLVPSLAPETRRPGWVGMGAGARARVGVGEGVLVGGSARFAAQASSAAVGVAAGGADATLRFPPMPSDKCTQDLMIACLASLSNSMSTQEKNSDRHLGRSFEVVRPPIPLMARRLSPSTSTRRTQINVSALAPTVEFPIESIHLHSVHCMIISEDPLKYT